MPGTTAKPTQKPPFKGNCTGGPLDGKTLASRIKRVTIPVVYPGQRGIGAGYYEFDPEAHSWVWKGG